MTDRRAKFGEVSPFEREAHQHGYAGRFINDVFSSEVDEDSITVEHTRDGTVASGKITTDSGIYDIKVDLSKSYQDGAHMRFETQDGTNQSVHLHVHLAAQGMLMTAVSTRERGIELYTPFGTWAAHMIGRIADKLDEYNEDFVR